MSGKTDLSLLLMSINPILQEGEYVFCLITSQDFNFLTLNPVAIFQEAEGTTLILEKQQADQLNLPYESIFCWITLSVHSSLNAVGFLAVVTTKLAEHNISVNPVSAYYHDHLFIPQEKAEQALQILLLYQV